MEVVAASPGNGSPFHNHDVREWSRLDSLTGVLERARLETDHWTASTATSSHKYNKVVDSRARSGADGNLQQQARRKLEVFQSQVPGGRLQVVKTQTVSSSRWTNKSPSDNQNEQAQFEDLKLSLNPLDLTSEKSKASVGRSVGRRPPSRSRIRDDIVSRNLHTTAVSNLHRVSRLCHQIHDSAVKRTFGKYNTAPPINERQSGDGVEITEIENENNHNNLSRTKSTSSEDLQDTKKSLEDLEDLEQLQNWRRTSKLRRSLQYPKQKASNIKPPDLPENRGSVKKIREDLETGRRLSTALRGNNVDLEALDQILKSISNSSVSSTYSDQKYEEPEKDDQITVKKQKRNSFVTVASIQAVRDRLRRTSSPGLDIPKKENEEPDDGIVTDQMSLKQITDMSIESKVKSYVYGMENGHKKNMSGTGSLESRSKQGNLFINRNEDWFSRRKSYGFEQMHNQQETISSKNKNRIESSTDSGICRSTEIVLVPTPTKSNSDRNYTTSESEEELKEVFKDDTVSNVKKYASIFEKKKEDGFIKPGDDLWKKRNKDAEGTKITIPISNKVGLREKSWTENGEIKRHSIAVDESKYINKVENKFKRTSLAINDKCEEDDDSGGSKKSNKKVEFCKTEVHFAADSGRVNIVETDEKPPPTQNFRRRRRNSGIPEDFNKNGLPVLHFGDTSYEKLLFADVDSEDCQGEAIYENVQNEVVSCGNVTVNANGNFVQEYEEQKENIENEAPKGILKNKPLKPRPYILGDTDDLMRSDSDTEKTWGVKLRPTQKDDVPVWRSTVTVRNTFYDQNETATSDNGETQPEFQKLLKQLRPTSKSADNHTENKRNSDSFNNVRIFSPIVDSRRSSWSVADRIKQVEDLKWTENKGYSTKVNIGNGEATVIENRHPTWPRREEYSKGRNDSNSKHTVCSKTTTNSDTNGTTTTTKITIDLTPSPTNESDFKFPRATIQSFKSPSLIMNTFKNECVNTELISKVKIPPQLEVLRKLYEEVHSDSEADKEVHQILMSKHEKHDDSGSVVSGSWSKMRAFKHINHYQKTKNGSHALIEKEPISNGNSKFHFIDQQLESDLKHLNQEAENLRAKKNYSPPFPPKPLKSAFTSEKLSSPYLVGRSKNQDQEISRIYEQNMQNIQETIVEANSKLLRSSPKVTIRNKSPVKEQVLRQPKKSEMAYFGVNVSPRPKQLDKPDLLQFNNNNNMKSKSHIKNPIYENLEPPSYKKVNNFDSSILEELTKAADQILQAVNGYTDEEVQNKYSTDDEKRPKHEVLDTISETKSWKQSTVNGKTTSSKTTVNRGKLKPTSSNSSIDSISRECRKVGDVNRKSFMTKSAEQKQRKKVVNGEAIATKATTKARRLQRASSREALLQSHGSSSEDLNANAEVIRKPRLVKKTKSTQLTVSNGIELKKPIAKKREEPKAKHEERVPVIGLPEIRHKTAVSTIRSTAEKAASREKAKLKADDAKKKLPSSKRDVSKGTTYTSKPERTRSSTNRDVIHRHTSVTSNKKTGRSESITKH